MKHFTRKICTPQLFSFFVLAILGVSAFSLSLSAQDATNPAPSVPASTPPAPADSSAPIPPGDSAVTNAAPSLPTEPDALLPGKKDKKIVGSPGAPANNATANGPTVRAIDIESVGFGHPVADSVILSNMRTSVGQPYTPSSVEEDVRNLYATGNFTNLRITDEPYGDGVKVIVTIQVKPTIKEIVIRGAAKIKESRVKKEIKSKVADRLNEAQISADTDKIKEMYLNKGYSQVQISYKIDTNDEYHRAVVTFTIDEGPRAYITEINFVGNDHLTTKELRKIMKTRRKNFLSFINKSGLYKDDDFRDDLSGLRDYYYSKGYIDMSVKDVRFKYPKAGEMNVVISVFEGIQYTVGKISFTGNTVYSDSELRVLNGFPIIRMSEGKVYSPHPFTPKGKEPNEQLPTLDNDRKRLEDLYGRKGYIEVEITPIQQPNLESGKMDILYSIVEKAQSYVEQIIIQGNSRTKDKVLRRELAIAPGEIYDRVRAENSKKRLEGLQYFEKVDISPEDTAIPNRKNMVITVEEKRTGSVTFGAGFSSVDSLLGFVEVTQGNFDLFNFPYFTGGGEKFRAKLQYGLERKDVTLNFKEPWFLEQRLELGYDLFYHDEQYLSNYYNQRTLGGDVSLSRGFGNFWRGSITYTLQDIDLYNFQSGASPELLLEQGSRSESSVTLGMEFDNRDNTQLSRSGTHAGFSAQLAGGPLLGQTDIYKLSADFQNYHLLPGDVIFSIGGFTGVVENYGKSPRVPIFDRFFLGGSRSVRGFPNQGIGPRDTSGSPIGGDTESYFNLEATFPIIDRVRGAVFTDAGYLDARPFDYTNAWRDLAAAAGLGLRLNLPIGPLRLDYGIPYKQDGHSPVHGKFSFDVGYQF